MTTSERPRPPRLEAHPLVVVKLGGSVLRDAADLSGAVHELYRHVRRGARVLAVVSAFHGRTDALARTAEALGADADPSDVARLLAVGEAESAAALVLALDRAGVPAEALDPRDVGPTCEGAPLDATPVALDRAAFHAAFRRVPVVVLPGFVGRTPAGCPAVLGRGGSDLSALFAAHSLEASRCVLLKDVEALYERDPAAARAPGEPAPRRLVRASWDDALSLAERGAGILQAKAVRFARAHAVAFEVAGAGGATGTRVDAGPTVVSAWRGAARPLAVGLAGLGTVGARVLAELAARPDLFEVRAVLVRDAARPGRPAAAQGLVTGDPACFLDHDVDVVVELCGGVEVGAALAREALARGRHVVTANKAALAVHGVALEALAERQGRELFASAAVGGAVPALEAVRRAALDPRGLVGFEGVLNGTSTFVLDALHGGASLADSVRDARAKGYAEADPTLDLDGTDLAQKVALLAIAAGFVDTPEALRWLAREGVSGATSSVRAGRLDSADASPPERLVGACHRSAVGPIASVTRRRPGARDPLASARGAGNVLVLHFGDGSLEVVAGRGAGAWPTATSVLADLFELARRHRRLNERPASLAEVNPRCRDDQGGALL